LQAKSKDRGTLYLGGHQEINKDQRGKLVGFVKRHARKKTEKRGRAEVPLRGGGANCGKKDSLFEEEKKEGKNLCWREEVHWT